MLVATLAISGVIPFAGYFSKDEILWRTWQTAPDGNWLFWGVGAVTALITAFYMFRLIMKTFFGTPRTDAARHAPESSLSMTLPLIVLAILSAITGWAVLSFKTFSDYLAPSVGAVPEVHNENMEPILGYGILVFILLMIGYAVVRYRGAKDGQLLSPQQRQGFLPRLVANKYYVDEAYNFWFVAAGQAVLRLALADVRQGRRGRHRQWGGADHFRRRAEPARLAEWVRPLLCLLDCRRHHPDPGDLRRALPELVTW